MSVFISYSSQDAQIADILEASLQRHGVAVIRDKDQMRGGGSWKDILLPQIASVNHFILLWSERARGLRAVHLELGRALEVDRSDYIIIIGALDDTPVPEFLENNQRFSIDKYGEGLNDLINAIVPLANSGQYSLTGDVRAAISNLVTNIRDRSSVYQVIYPDELVPSDKIIALAIADGFPDGPQTNDVTIEELLHQRDGLTKIALLGHPGSGKTTSLQYIAYRLVRDVAPTQQIPILLRCRNFTVRKFPTFNDFIYAAIRELTSFSVENVLRSEKIDKNSSVTLLIDGIDELRAGSEEVFFRLLHDFLEDPDTNIARVIVSSRFDAFHEAEKKLEGWHRYSLMPFDDEQIHNFVNNWFDDATRTEPLIARLMDRRLAELASRPFLLAMICLVFQRGGDLGLNRSELYAKAVTYLERRHADIVPERTVRIRRLVLQALALRSLQLGTGELDKWTAAGIAASVLAKEGEQLDSFETTIKQLDEAARDVGILQSALGRYSFLHRTFQEFLVSLALLNSPEDEGSIIEYCRLRRWEEPIRLYVGGLKTPEEQAGLLRRLWCVNQDLTLRALTDASRLRAGFASELLSESRPADRVHMLSSVRSSLADVDAQTRQRLVFETVEPLLHSDSDSEVIYNAIELVRWVDPSDRKGLLWNSFGRNARQLRESLLTDECDRFAFVEIGPGDFTMGANDSIDEIERPAHRVAVSSFLISVFQLTNRSFDNVNKRNLQHRDSVSKDDLQPAVGLNWFDAYVVAFRLGCRLPTEAEWEYAARAGGTGNWCFGNDETKLKEYAKYEGVEPAGQPWIVGSGTQNAFGIFDMHGNVWEWCSDWLAPYTSDYQSDPTGPAAGTARVRRGGGHSYHARGCRSAFRWGNDPSYRFKDIGVRIVLDNELVERGW